MCFKNLPIEFDSQGRPYLRVEVPNPYRYEVRSLAEQEERIKELLARNG